MPEEDVVGFVVAELGSVWAIELMALLRRDLSRCWRKEELTSELRASPIVVQMALERLQRAALVSAGEEGEWRFEPQDAASDRLALKAIELYKSHPAMIKKLLYGKQDGNLRLFADAFKFGKD